jgi:serine/threonine-protein kinase RsbT
MTTTIAAPEGVELARLPIARIQDVLVARVVVRGEAVRLGFGAQALTQIATAVSEITRNVVQHSGGTGQLRVFELADEGRRGIRIAVEDNGSGIADVERVLEGTSPGAGIPGCRRLMDEFGIRSSAGQGTTVTMVKWLRRS